MTFLRGLLAGRSHLAFLVGLAGAFAAVHATSDVAEPAAGGWASSAADVRALPLRRPAPLSRRERELAETAWSYFARNTDPRTGLTSSVKGYPSTTMWDVGSQLMATIAAEDLQLVSRADALERLERALESLGSMPLCNSLPNKAYDTRTLEMVGYDNVPVPGGIGWSALDVARALVPLSLLVRRAPELAPAVERVVARWSLDRLTEGAALRGATRGADGVLHAYQEGRLGYEQYAAKALLLWGITASTALDYRAHLEPRRVGGRLVPVDDRHPRDHGGAHNAVTSEPWLLDGLEFGLDSATADLARSILAAQERRYLATRRITAVSEDAIDRKPGFAYSAVVNGDDEWTAFLPDGTRAPHDLGFSVKAALAWAVLFSGTYPDELFDAAVAVGGDADGLFAGRYDEGGEINRAVSLNTNAVVLEALAYRARGPFLRAPPSSAHLHAEAEVRQ